MPKAKKPRKAAKPSIALTDPELNRSLDQIAKSMTPATNKTELLKAIAKAAVDRFENGQPIFGPPAVF